MTFVPSLHDEKVLALCKRVHPTNTPVYVPLRPEKGHVVKDCFPNVKNRVKAEGGRIVYGWALWQNPWLIEAEHHAVYEPPDGSEWVDVTPQDDIQTDRILFLPDEGLVEDETGSIRRDNVRMSLVDDGRVKDLITLYEMKNQVLNSVPGTGRVALTGQAAQQMVKVETVIKNIEMALYFERMQGSRNQPTEKAGRNDPCPCGSRKKFKKCCGA